MQMFMDQQVTNAIWQETAKALKNIICKVTRFNRKNIIRFLKFYSFEMKIYQVLKDMIIKTLDLVVVSKIKKKMRQVHESILSKI